MKIGKVTFAVILLSQGLLSQDYYADYIFLGSGYYSGFSSATAVPVDIGYFAVNNQTVLEVQLQIKKNSATIFSVPEVGMTAVTFSACYGYHFSETSVKPYVAGGMLVGFNGINSGDVTRRRPDLVINNNVAESYGIFVLAGIHFMVSNRTSFFIDYRIGVDYLYTSIENQGDEFVNLGGQYIRAGVRIAIDTSEDF
ncbi:MAG: hypothetical protein HYV29_08020 [Ignavibacteriales bacterium]|nr:hypothetical protein [Ignavibacteriales bacterium]